MFLVNRYRFFVMQIVPWAAQVRDLWRSFHIPLWNDLAGAGYPLLANGQSSAFSFIRVRLPPPSIQSTDRWSVCQN